MKDAVKKQLDLGNIVLLNNLGKHMQLFELQGAIG